MHFCPMLQKQWQKFEEKFSNGNKHQTSKCIIRQGYRLAFFETVAIFLAFSESERNFEDLFWTNLGKTYNIL